MIFLETILRQNRIKIHQMVHQIAPLKKNFFFGGGMPPNPLAKRMASPYTACHFATCKFQNLKTNFLDPHSKSWLRPCSLLHFIGL